LSKVLQKPNVVQKSNSSQSLAQMIAQMIAQLENNYKSLKDQNLINNKQNIGVKQQILSPEYSSHIISPNQRSSSGQKLHKQQQQQQQHYSSNAQTFHSSQQLPENQTLRQLISESFMPLIKLSPPPLPKNKTNNFDNRQKIVPTIQHQQQQGVGAGALQELLMKTKESQMRSKSTGSKLNQIMAELKEKHSLNSVPVPVTQTMTPYKPMPAKEIVISQPLSENSLQIAPIIEALNRELSNDSLNSSPNSLRIAESPINLSENKTREESEEVIIDDEEKEKSRKGTTITPVIKRRKRKMF
jgi:diadenosine tetraphosphate (Ap4A) HIT family hydrolase